MAEKVQKRNRLKHLQKIRLHREGTHSLVLGALVLMLFNLSLALGMKQLGVEENTSHIIMTISISVCAILYAIVLNFFRCPPRLFEGDTYNTVIAPCDGRVVVIEEVEENEYFHDRRLMVSIFMSLVDVHANWVPVEGTVKLVRHHDGNYHAAWLPKASIENERSTVVITTPQGVDVMARQVAGAMARRVVTYVQEGEQCEIDEHMGFIKFGSRVDVYLPLGTSVLVEKGQRTIGNKTIIAKLNQDNISATTV